jgi:hypothetical protein
VKAASSTPPIVGLAHLVLFFKVEDVAPDVNASFKVTRPAFVHRFGQGSQIRLVLAVRSINYRGGVTATSSPSPGERARR